MPSVLFVCVANSLRSQMAEAIAKSLRPSGWEIWSAGSNPSGIVHPVAHELMEEIGLSLDGHRSKGLDGVPQRRWDYVVTMGCGDRCPATASIKRMDWQIPDPAGLPIEQARRIRDELAAKIQTLLDRTDPA